MGREEVKKATPPIAAPLLPTVQVLLSTVFSFVPMSGNRPIILRQKFLSVADSVARYLHIRNNDWFPLRALWF